MTRAMREKAKAGWGLLRQGLGLKEASRRLKTTPDVLDELIWRWRAMKTGGYDRP